MCKKVNKLTTILLFSLSVATAVVWASSCGLPSATPVLPDPEAPAASGSTFTFTHPGGTDPQPPGIENVNGYEVYYKFYAPTEEGVVDDSLDDEDITAVADRTQAGALPTNALVTQGFRRINGPPEREGPGGTRVVPLILIDPADVETTITVSITFTVDPLSFEEPTVAYAGESFVIRRAVDNGDLANQQYQRFSPSEIEVSDGDVPEEIGQIPGALRAGLSLVAFAYGQGVDLSSPLYSTPIPLGMITIPLQ